MQQLVLNSAQLTMVVINVSHTADLNYVALQKEVYYEFMLHRRHIGFWYLVMRVGSDC